jgi:hypothetical protein
MKYQATLETYRANEALLRVQSPQHDPLYEDVHAGTVDVWVADIIILLVGLRFTRTSCDF